MRRRYREGRVISVLRLLQQQQAVVVASAVDTRSAVSLAVYCQRVHCAARSRRALQQACWQSQASLLCDAMLYAAGMCCCSLRYRGISPVGSGHAGQRGARCLQPADCVVQPAQTVQPSHLLAQLGYHSDYTSTSDTTDVHWPSLRPSSHIHPRHTAVDARHSHASSPSPASRLLRPGFAGCTHCYHCCLQSSRLCA